jgi:uridine kinase
MIGDKVIPKPHHTAAAEGVFALLREKVGEKRTTITVAGESGAGKSEIAVEVARLFEAQGVRPLVLQQDDYFFLPPKTNAETRKKNIKHVGLSEVNLALLDEHMRTFKFNPSDAIDKPLVIFDEDRISRETVAPSEYNVLISEGTYTTLLSHGDYHVFIDRNFEETLSHRKARKRDELDEFSERILEIEHGIISKHKRMANIVVNNDYSVTWVGKET